MFNHRFSAMASPCEVLVAMPPHGAQPAQEKVPRTAFQLAEEEAKRIEHKFSRYRDDNIIYRLNNAGGDWVQVDPETSKLLDYADSLYALSDGLFDITSGVLRRLWRFDGKHGIPDKKSVKALLKRIGWKKIKRLENRVRIPAGMEIDLGGIGKEYAVDRAALLIEQALIEHGPNQQEPADQGLPGTSQVESVLINFGGDIRIVGCRQKDWEIAVDDPFATGKKVLGSVKLRHGAIATSGDARRFILHKGVRYSHILNPKTGWPVKDAPRSITVCAPTCLEAGMLSTLAMLQGSGAEAFLQAQQVPHWIIRPE